MKAQYPTIKALLACLNLAKTEPHCRVKMSWCETLNGAQFRQWFRECLNAKINRDTPQTGRKHSFEYQANLRRDVQRIRDAKQRRAFMSGRNLLSTPELKHLYPDIDNRPFEL